MAMTAEVILERFNDDVDNQMRKLLEKTDPFIANMAGYFFGWVDQSFRPTPGRKGKKLRPTLNLLVHEAITGTYTPSLPMAAALEILHNYSLIHDDIEDRDEERRGRPTVWKVWGDGLALNCGSALHALAFQSIINMAGVSAAVRVELCGLLIQTSVRLCEGQHLDMSYETTTDVTQTMYLEMIDRKTADLIECSTYSGALLATNDQDLITAYKNFGRNLGLAFQVRDDYLNLWVDGKSVGKPQYSDIKKRKKTLPVIHTLNSLPSSEREKLLDLYTHSEGTLQEEQVAYVLDCLNQAGAREYTAEMANHYVDEAVTWLDQIKLDNPAQTQLRVLASFLTGRNF